MSIWVTRRRDARAAKRFFRKLLKVPWGHHGSWLPTSCEAIWTLAGNSGCRLPIEPGSTRTVGLRCPTSTPASEPSPLGRPRRVFNERRTMHQCAHQNRFCENNLTIPLNRLKAPLKRSPDLDIWGVGNPHRAQLLKEKTTLHGTASNWCGMETNDCHRSYQHHTDAPYANGHAGNIGSCSLGILALGLSPESREF